MRKYLASILLSFLGLGNINAEQVEKLKKLIQKECDKNEIKMSESMISENYKFYLGKQSAYVDVLMLIDDLQDEQKKHRN